MDDLLDSTNYDAYTFNFSIDSKACVFVMWTVELCSQYQTFDEIQSRSGQKCAPFNVEFWVCRQRIPVVDPILRLEPLHHLSERNVKHTWDWSPCKTGSHMNSLYHDEPSQMESSNSRTTYSIGTSYAHHLETDIAQDQPMISLTPVKRFQTRPNFSTPSPKKGLITRITRMPRH